MTRCECAGLTFEEAARQIQTLGRTLEELKRTTGCGGTCTACIPDLRRYLATLSR
jgi:bacterioferritin-associated ferredoxin